MEKFFEAITGPTIWGIAILEIALTGYLVYRFCKTKSWILLADAVITFGLFFDAFIIALGMFIKADTMPFLGRMRFVFHGILIPLLFVVSERAIGLKKPWNFVVYGITGVLIVVGLVEASLDVLVESNVANISRLMVDKVNTPKWAYKYSSMINIVGIIPLIAAGIYEWIKEKNPFLCISGIAMFFFSAIGPAIGAKNYIFFISMIGEILMVFFIYLFDWKKAKKKESK